MVAVGTAVCTVAAFAMVAYDPKPESLTPGVLLLVAIQLLVSNLVWALAEFIAILVTLDGSLHLRPATATDG